MRNLLIILKILILTLIVAKKPDTTGLRKIHDEQNKVKEEQPVDKQIKTILKDNAIKLDEIEKIKIKNDRSIEEIEALESRKKSLLRSISSKIDNITQQKKDKFSKKSTYIDKDIVKTKDLVDIKIDSTCVSYKRKNVFTKSKCSKWEYYAYILGANNKKIMIK